MNERRAVHLPPNYESKLDKLAVGTGMSREALVEKALDLLFQLAAPADGVEHPASWQNLGLEAFTRDWDNEDDRIYDDWKSHYGIAG